jgi:hypothetical protein
MRSPRDLPPDHQCDHPRDQPCDCLRDRAAEAEKEEVISPMQKRWGAWGGVPIGGANITVDALVRLPQPQPSRFSVRVLRLVVPTHPAF